MFFKFVLLCHILLDSIASALRDLFLKKKKIRHPNIVTKLSRNATTSRRSHQSNYSNWARTYKVGIEHKFRPRRRIRTFEPTSTRMLPLNQSNYRVFNFYLIHRSGEESGFEQIAKQRKIIKIISDYK